MTDASTLPQITAEDIAVPDGITASLYSKLMSLYRSSTRIGTYGKTVLPPLHGLHNTNLQDQTDGDTINALSIVAPRLWELAEYITRTPQVLAEAINHPERMLNVKHRGLQISDWNIESEGVAYVKPSAIDKVLDGFATLMTPEQQESCGFDSYSSYLFYLLTRVSMLTRICRTLTSRGYHEPCSWLSVQQSVMP